MNKMQKHTLAKVLKVIFYMLGFPLLLVLVAKDSMVYFNESTFDGTAYNGILAVFLIWLGITLVQIGLYLVMKKHQALRTIIVVILAIVIMLAPFAAMDKKNEQTIKEVQAKYADKAGVVINDYYLQKQHYNTLYWDLKSYTDLTLNSVDEMMRIYNLKYYYPHVYRTHSQLNTTIYYKTADGTTYDWSQWDKIKESSPLAYNQNGLLADNYVFGVENALDLLIKYNEYSTLTVYRPVNGSRYTLSTVNSLAIANKWYIKNSEDNYVRYKDGDSKTGTFYEKLAIADAYNQMVSELNDGTYNYEDADVSWADYVNDAVEIVDTRTGKKTNYSTLKAEADNYILTEQRLNDVLAVVFEYLGAAPGLNDILQDLNLGNILTLVGALLTADDSDLDGGAIGTVISALLYGYNNGMGGTTTGLALPAQYLFGNISLSSSEVKKLAGKLDVAGGSISEADAMKPDNKYKVFTITYKQNADNPQKYDAKLAYEIYDSTMVIGIPADKTSITEGVKYTTGEVYTTQPLTAAYDAYKSYLESNYSGTTDGGYDYTAVAALTDIIKSLQPALGLVGSLLDSSTIMGLLGGVLPGLDLEAILGKILKAGALDAVIADLLGGIDLTAITPEGVSSLLMGILGDLSYYQHPLLKKCWQSDFVTGTDQTLIATNGTVVNLADYAWNKYACEDFGIANGCALIAKGGLLSGTTLGLDTPADEAFTLTELYQLKANLEYQTEMYPLLSARRYVNMWYGLIVVSIFFSTYFYNKEKKYLYEAMIIDGGNY